MGLFDVLTNFLLPQVERIVIISNKHGIYELPHEVTIAGEARNIA